MSDIILGHAQFHPYDNLQIPPSFIPIERPKEMSKKYEHLMIDLETLGTLSDSVILSIGAIPFDIQTGEMGKEIDFFPNVEHQLDHRKVTWGSIKFWLSQNSDAIKAITEVQRSILLGTCLYLFAEFCKDHLTENFKIWGNGFDVSLLNHAYAQYNIETPWSYKNIFDCRTIVWLSKISTSKYIENTDLKHDAISDCKYQIRFVSDAFKVLKY